MNKKIVAYPLLTRLLTTLCVLALAPAFSYADSGFLVKKIKLEGVASSLYTEVAEQVPVKVGQACDESCSENIIQTLYKTGYFDNLQVWQEDNTLLIKTHQRPTIANITFTGNEDIKTDDLNKVLLQAGLQTGDLLNRSVLRQVKQSLLDQYYSQGKYAVRISTDVEELPRDRVDVNIKISEGLVTKIQRINVVGATAFSQKQLIDQLEIGTPSIITFFTSADKYSQQKMLQSMDALTSFYMNRGYINFRINSTQVSLSPNKKQMYVNLNVSEGSQYTFSGYSLSGDLIIPQLEMEGLVKVQKGQLFSRQAVLDSERAIANRLGDKGYAFATVNPIPQMDEKTKTVFVQFYVTPGKRYRVRHVNFTGNVSTNDQVFRQQMRYAEGSVYNYSKVQNSKERLMRYYSFLSDANEKNTPVKGSNDLVDTDFSVKEQSANQVTASIGYSQLYQEMLGLGLSMPNLFGTGNIFSINSQLSKPFRSLNFTYTEPYFTMSGISQSVGFYLTQINNSYTSISGFSTNSYGATLNYSVPLTDYDFFNFGAGLDHTHIFNTTDPSSATVSQFITDYGNAFNTYTLNLGWSRNTSNRAYFPTKGDKESINGTLAGPGSTLTWYKILTSAAFFHPVTQNTSFSLGGDVNFGNGYWKTRELPIYQNFYGGGWGTVRGYGDATLGPMDTLVCLAGDATCTAGEGQALGGNLLVNASADLFFPIPGMADNNNIRWGTFVDAGNVYATYNNPNAWAPYPNYPNFSNLRYSVGLALEWQIPHLGPLAISFAKPLNEKVGDQINIFQFSIGGMFNN